MDKLFLDVHHVTRVEGHGNIVIDVREGEIKELKLEIVESPRFFEAMLLDRHAFSAPHITCRICGICSISHSCSSLKAVEEAMGMELSDYSSSLRHLMLYGEILQSHILHAFFLALPDFFNAPDTFSLMSSHPDAVKAGLSLKKMANLICGVGAGRHIHPISMVPGGFASYPSREALVKLRDELLAREKLIEAMVGLFSGLKVPDAERETEYVSLGNTGRYEVYEGYIISSRGWKIKNTEYLNKVREKIVSHSTAKHSYTGLNTYMVGALARFNNNFEYLNDRAASAASAFGMTPPCHNPFKINFAQVIEIVHFYYESLKSLDWLIQNHAGALKPGETESGRQSGEGVGIVEAPRGLLIHNYTVQEGKIKSANCVIPTAQNLENIENDLYKFIPEILGKMDEDGIRMFSEMLVRAYDPCISCSAHVLDMKFLNGK